MSLTAEERKTLADLDYIARKFYEGRISPELTERLRLFSIALVENTYKLLPDSNKAELISIMASTPDGIWWRNQQNNLLDQLAAELGTTIYHWVPPLPQDPTPVPPQPPVIVTDEFTQAVVASLAKLNIHVRPNKIAIGMKPLSDAAAIQIGGDAPAVVLGMSNAYADGRARQTDGQNPDEVHINTFVVADNDGGIRWRQYLQWINGTRTRNTQNRRASVLALDSQGDLCKSTMEVGSNTDGGQSWYIRTEGLVVEFCTYKVGAFIRILKSVTGYGARDEAQL